MNQPFSSWVLEHMGTHEKYRLLQGDNTIGRHSECSLRFTHDFISRKHAIFSINENEVKLKCMGAVNGVYVNGTRLNGSTKTLAVNDEISIGVTECMYPLGPRDLIFKLKFEPNKYNMTKNLEEEIVIISDDEMMSEPASNNKQDAPQAASMNNLVDEHSSAEKIVSSNKVDIHLPQIPEIKTEFVRQQALKIEDIFGEADDVILDGLRPLNPYVFKELATNKGISKVNGRALCAGESIDISSDNDEKTEEEPAEVFGCIVDNDEEDNDSGEFLFSQVLINEMKEDLAHSDNDNSLAEFDDDDISAYIQPQSNKKEAPSSDKNAKDEDSLTASDEYDEELTNKVHDWSTKLSINMNLSQIYEPNFVEIFDSEDEDQNLNNVNKENADEICAIIDEVFRNEYADDNITEAKVQNIADREHELDAEEAALLKQSESMARSNTNLYDNSPIVGIRKRKAVRLKSTSSEDEPLDLQPSCSKKTLPTTKVVKKSKHESSTREKSDKCEQIHKLEQQNQKQTKTKEHTTKVQNLKESTTELGNQKKLLPHQLENENLTKPDKLISKKVENQNTTSTKSTKKLKRSASVQVSNKESVKNDDSIEKKRRDTVCTSGLVDHIVNTDKAKLLQKTVAKKSKETDKAKPLIANKNTLIENTNSTTPRSTLKRRDTVCVTSLLEHINTDKAKAKPLPIAEKTNTTDKSKPLIDANKDTLTTTPRSRLQRRDTICATSLETHITNITPQRRGPSIINVPHLPVNRGKLRGFSALSHSSGKNNPKINKPKDNNLLDARKDRLKQIAEADKTSKSKTSETAKRKLSTTSTVRVKVTEQSRGAFLAQEIQPPPPKKPCQVPATKTQNGVRPKTDVCKNKDEPVPLSNNGTTTKIMATFSQQLCAPDKILEMRAKLARPPAERKDKIAARANRTMNKVTFASMESKFEQNEKSYRKLDELNKNNNMDKEKHKKVRFADHPIIHYIERITSAVRKVEGAKDFVAITTTPYEHRRYIAQQKYEIIDHTNEVINDILQWSNEWLRAGCANQAAANDIVLPMANEYRSYEHYKSVIIPLMKLEFQSTLERDYRVRHKPFDVVMGTVTPSIDRFVLLTRYYKQKACRFDLVTIKLPKEQTEFAYLKAMRRGNKGDCWIFVYEILAKNYTKEYLEKLTTLTIHPIVENVRIELGALNAVHQLRYTPLFKHIVDPRQILIDVMPPMKMATYKGYDHLNNYQEHVLLSTYIEAIDENRPSIKLIQGPPGTGKSRLIVNLILQCLYGREVRLRDRKILVCAQSNEAINNIASHLKKVADHMRSETRFSIIRFGVLEKMCETSKILSLDHFLEGARKAKFGKPETEKTKNLKFQKTQLENEISAMLMKKSKDAIDEKNLSDKFKQLNGIRSILRETFTPEEERELARGVLNRTNIVCTTLASCVKLAQNVDYFDICIIDEATQCTEPMTLLPLKFGMPSLVLVGDTQQLPATVLSRKASDAGLSKSMFARIKNCIEMELLKNPSLYNGKKDLIIMQLLTQYRMHPEICQWPNATFYNNQLKNSETTKSHITPLQPYCVINLKYTNGDIGMHGKITNVLEAKFVAKLIKAMDEYIPIENHDYGIISPYAPQCNVLLQEINSENLNMHNIMIKTIDSYQGLEKDVIIVSNARTKGVGFMANPQRLNVALTRAKKCLIICGNFQNLETETIWQRLLDDARKRKRYLEINENSIKDIKTNVIKKMLLPKTTNNSSEQKK